MDVSSSASPPCGQHAYQLDPAQDAHSPTPRAASSPEAQLPASNHTSNDEPEGSDPEDTGVCCPVVHETGDGAEPAHNNHAHETHQLDGIRETAACLRLQPRAFPSETSTSETSTSETSTSIVSTPGESSPSSLSIPMVQDPCPEEARQGTSRPPSATHRDPRHSPDLSGLAQKALAAAAPTSRLPNVGSAVRRSGIEQNVIAPLFPLQARLSSDLQEDPRNPQATQVFHRPSDEIQPPSLASAQPSAARTLPCDSTPAWWVHQSVSLGQTPPSQLITKPLPGALLSSVGQERGGAPAPPQQPFRPPVSHPNSSRLRPLLPRPHHDNENSPVTEHLGVEHGIKTTPEAEGRLAVSFMLT